MNTFHLERLEDETGISGTGRVAEGVVFSNGWCALVWLTKHTSCAFYTSIQEVEAIHGHKGRTIIVWGESPKMTDAFDFVEKALEVAKNKTPDDWAYAQLDAAVEMLRKARAPDKTERGEP